jgi:hypothetical protein
VSDNQAPKVTSLPAGSTESPLVIDLPDGQKLVVGNIPNGTVIEVATWRGTGRPDSRTNRMMLGVSSAEVAITKEEDEKREAERLAQDPAQSKMSKYLGILNFPKRFIFWLIKKEPKPRVNVVKRESLESASQNSSKSNSKAKPLRKLSFLNRLSKSVFSSRKGRVNQKTEPSDDILSQETSEWLNSLLGNSDYKSATDHSSIVNRPAKTLKSKKPTAGSKKPPSGTKKSSKKNKR